MFLRVVCVPRNASHCTDINSIKQDYDVGCRQFPTAHERQIQQSRETAETPPSPSVSHRQHLFSLLLPLMRSGAMTSRHVTVTSLTDSRDRPTINVANDDYVSRTASNLIAVAWCRHPLTVSAHHHSGDY